jgi:hypothetical protein
MKGKGKGNMNFNGNVNFKDGIIILLDLLLGFVRIFIFLEEINIATTNALDPSIFPCLCFEDEAFLGRDDL